MKKNTAPFGTLMNDWTTPELFTTPVPVSIKLVPSLEVIVNGSAPLLNTMLSSSTVVLLKRFVTFDVSKFAMSDGPFGTVFGIQFAAVFHSLLEGFVLHVALPARQWRCAARDSSAAATTKMNLFIQMRTDEVVGTRLLRCVMDRFYERLGMRLLPR